MEQCIVCLKCNEDTFSRININSSEWNECNIQRIIEKHLWWWYPKKSTTSSVQWICGQCWQELSSFHNFYRTIVQLHRQYQSMLTSCVISEIYDNKLRNRKSTESNDDVQEISIADVKSEFRFQSSDNEDKNERKIRNRKSSECNANIQIEEINIVDVKSEFRFESNDNGDKNERKIRNRKSSERNANVESEEINIVDVKSEFRFESNDKGDKNERKIRNRKSSECNANIEIEEINIVDVKSEFRFESNDNGDKNVRKIRNRKSSERNANVESEEINIVDVKSEFRFESNDNGDKVYYQCGDTEKSAKYEVDSPDIDTKDFVDTNCNDSEESNHVAGCGIEDKILVPFTKNAKTKLIQKNKRKALTKTKSVKASSKKNKTKHKSEVKLNKLVNDDFFKESQHKLECSICNKSLSEFRTLKEHFRNEHNICGYALCCGKKFFKRHLLIDHINVHKNPEYFKCNLCNKLFNLRRCLETHIKTHAQRERIFRCEDCGKSYFTEKVFERHKLSHVPEDERNFPCNHCDKKFAARYLQLQHETTTHNKKYFKSCDICGKSYRDNFSLLRHMEEHAGATPSFETCNLCGVKLTNKYALTQHIKMRHNEENLQEPICPFCSRVSPNINAHRKHIQYAHTMERKHSCHMCDKSFKRPVELREHLSTHTGVPLYTCPHCPKTFFSNSNKYTHRKLAHRKEWQEERLKKFNKPRRKLLSSGLNE